MQQMRFGFQDIFKAPRLALSLQRIWIQFVGLLVGYVGYLIFTYVSIAVTGLGLSLAWKKYGLLPCLFPEMATWYSYVIFAVGVVWLVVVYLVTATAVSRATYMLAKGNNFYTWKEAFRFSIKKTGSVVASPLAIVILIALFVIGGLVVGLIGKIPYIGELGLTLFTPLWFIASLLIVFFVLVLGVAMLQVPAVIATTDDDAFEAVFQSFSILWSQPWRLIFYEALTGVLSLFGFVVLAYLSKKAFIVCDRIFAYSMGADFINISAHAMYMLSVWVTHSIVWMKSIFGDFAGFIYFSREFDPLMIPGYQIVSAYFFAIWYLIIGGFIVSYGISSFNVGNTITYLILRKKKDDENLLERKDREEEEEEEEEEKEKKEETEDEDKEEKEKKEKNN